MHSPVSYLTLPCLTSLVYCWNSREAVGLRVVGGRKEQAVEKSPVVLSSAQDSNPPALAGTSKDSQRIIHT